MRICTLRSAAPQWELPRKRPFAENCKTLGIFDLPPISTQHKSAPIGSHGQKYASPDFGLCKLGSRRWATLNTFVPGSRTPAHSGKATAAGGNGHRHQLCGRGGKTLALTVGAASIRVPRGDRRRQREFAKSRGPISGRQTSPLVRGAENPRLDLIARTVRLPVQADDGFAVTVAGKERRVKLNKASMRCSPRGMDLNDSPS